MILFILTCFEQRPPTDKKRRFFQSFRSLLWGSHPLVETRPATHAANTHVVSYRISINSYLEKRHTFFMTRFKRREKSTSALMLITEKSSMKYVARISSYVAPSYSTRRTFLGFSALASLFKSFYLSTPSSSQFPHREQRAFSLSRRNPQTQIYTRAKKMKIMTENTWYNKN